MSRNGILSETISTTGRIPTSARRDRGEFSFRRGSVKGHGAGLHAGSVFQCHEALRVAGKPGTESRRNGPAAAGRALGDRRPRLAAAGSAGPAGGRARLAGRARRLGGRASGQGAGESSPGSHHRGVRASFFRSAGWGLGTSRMPTSTFSGFPSRFAAARSIAYTRAGADREGPQGKLSGAQAGTCELWPGAWSCADQAGSQRHEVIG